MRGLHSPFPASLRCESKKATRILESFITPSFGGSPGTELPANVLQNAKGLIICTVFRAGFFGSGRFGSGVIVARREDGSWSPPSAIRMVGGGLGSLVGVEITDFVFVLNDDYAVNTFLRQDCLSLSGNVSLACGPLGRSVEFAGGASLRGAAAIFSYAKTKGMFAGASVEGAIFIEGRSASRKLYGENATAGHLLKGTILPPPEVQPLMDVLALDIFHPEAPTYAPVYKTVDLSREGVVELPAGEENLAVPELHSESSPQHGYEGHESSHST